MNPGRRRWLPRTPGERMRRCWNACAAIHGLIPYIHQMQLLGVSLSRHKEKTVEEHRRIAGAIAENRSVDAFDAMQFHLMMIQERLVQKE